MCDRLIDGGKRCDCDNSDKRRLRRKMTQVLNSASNIRRFDNYSDSLQHFENIEELKSGIQKVQQDFKKGALKNETDKEFYSRMESQTTFIGSAIIGLAKSDKNFSLSKEDKKKVLYNERLLKKEQEDFEEKIRDIRNIEQEATSIVSELYSQYSYGSKYYTHIEEMFGKEGKSDFVESYEIDVSVDENIDNILAGGDLSESDQQFLNDLKTTRRTFDEFKKSYDSKRQEFSHIFIKIDKLQKKDSSLKAKYFSESLRSVLSQIREMGGESKFKKGSSSDLVELMNKNVLRNYPKQWLDYHNNEIPMGVNYGESMNDTNDGVDGFYQHEVVNDYVATDKVSKAPKYGAWAAFKDSEMYIAEHVLKDLKIDYKQESVELGKSKNSETRSFIFYDSLEMRTDEPGEDEIEYWEKRPHPYMLREFISENSSILSNFSKEDNIARAKKFVEDNPIWLRKESTSSEISSQILLNKENDDADDERKNSLLLHEFGHRMERVVPDDRLLKLEKAFLDRRSDAIDSDKGSAMGDKSKMMYDAFFFKKTDVLTDPYSSRVYPNGKSTEIFTTGIQSVFYGDYKRLDRDHQSFVVGSLAIV